MYAPMCLFKMWGRMSVKEYESSRHIFIIKE